MLICNKLEAQKAFLSGCTIVIYGAMDVEFEIKTREHNKIATEKRRFNNIVNTYKTYTNSNTCMFAISNIALEPITRAN